LERDLDRIKKSIANVYKLVEVADWGKLDLLTAPGGQRESASHPGNSRLP